MTPQSIHLFLSCFIQVFTAKQKAYKYGSLRQLLGLRPLQRLNARLKFATSL